MSSLIRFVPVLHLHVPPGLGEGDLRYAHRNWHRPMVDAIEQAEGLAFTFHISGYLFRWLSLRQPAFIERLKELVEAGRLELLAGGWADPFLSSVPEHDAIAQLDVQARLVQLKTGQRPRGAHLAEGVWDPVMPRLLSRANLDFAFVRGEHLLATGVPSRTVHGWFLTERNGASLRIIPTEPYMEGLVERTTGMELLGILSNRLASGASGLSWVGSVSKLARGRSPAGFINWFTGLLDTLGENAHWVRTTLPSELIDRYPCTGRLYLPSWMPAEIAECALGVSAGDLRGDGMGAFPGSGHYFRAGTWETLLIRYEESNRVHKRMVQSSIELQRLRGRVARSKANGQAKRAVEAASLALYRGQGSAVYWHGPTGGIYDPGVRNGTYAALAECDHIVARSLSESAKVRALRTDYDWDGSEEFLVRTPHLGAIIDANQGGTLVQLDSWRLPGNVLGLPTRRDEPWHSPLEPFGAYPVLVMDDDSIEDSTMDETLDRPEGVWSTQHTDDASISKGRTMAFQRLTRLRDVDRTPRSSFKDHFLGPLTTLDNLRRERFDEQGDFVESSYQVLAAESVDEETWALSMSREGSVTQGTQAALVQVRKRFVCYRGKSQIDVQYEISNRFDRPVETRFGVELNFGAASSSGAGQYLLLARGRRHPAVHEGEHAEIGVVGLEDEARRLRMVVKPSQPAHLMHYPIHTVSRGWEAPQECFQGTCLMLTWPVQLWGDEKWSVSISLAVDPGADIDNESR